MRLGRRLAGAALLEAVAALAILAAAAVGMLVLSRESAAVLDHVRRAEQELTRASRFVAAVSLWPNAVLDQRLGERQQGDWRLVIEKRGTLYLIALVDTASSRVILRTAVHRRSGSSTNAP